MLLVGRFCIMYNSTDIIICDREDVASQKILGFKVYNCANDEKTAEAIARKLEYATWI